MPTPSPPLVRDPYQFHDGDVADPPRALLPTLRKIGPGMILAASIVGSGELIATTTLGAEVGYVALWVIVLSCLIKPAVQAEMGRYTIATGETGLAGFNRVPGPRFFGVNWVVWGWVAMMVMTRFQIGAMFGGVAQTLNYLMPGVPVAAWVLSLVVITLWLLLGGGYERVEHIATIKVGLFTMLTLLCAIMLTRRSDLFHWGQVLEGFTFQLPGNGLATAIAVFGVTGVGAAELFMYPYWCVEKGYARFAGKIDGSPAWKARAEGWIRVMQADILMTMLIYTVATVAFFLLGAGILHPQGLVPRANDMIPVLSQMYIQTLGPWSAWLFYIGAIATLYGTIFAATAAESRVFADLCRLMGRFHPEDYPARIAHRRKFVWTITILSAGLYLVVQSPVTMVKAGGVAQALMLPVIAYATLYLRYKHLPKIVAPSTLMNTALWIASISIIAMMTYYAVLVLRPALGFERQPRILQRPPPAIEGNRPRVAHLAQVIRHQRRPEAAAAIEHQLCGLVRHLRLDIALDHALAQVDSALHMARRPFALLAHIHQHMGLLNLGLIRGQIDLRHAGLGICHQSQESFVVFHALIIHPVTSNSKLPRRGLTRSAECSSGRRSLAAPA